MRNQIEINGKQVFMEKEIPVVYGGFGENQKCMSDNTLAEIHNVTTSDIRKSIGRNLTRFKNDVDIIDLKSPSSGDDLLESLGYSKQQIIQAEHIYILSERGYAKLIKIMDTDLAWKIHDRLVDEYFELREYKDTTFSQLSPQLQLLINIERQQKKQEKALEDTNQKVDDISEIVALNTINWRQDAKALIAKIAVKMGGYEYLRDIQAEIYKTIDGRLAVSLETRLTNKRRRMADEGICKSKRDKLTKVDVIADDKKLIEGYVAIVKEFAIKYGVTC
ncbi:MAG: ORF6N domain-containing protein [Aminipila sp.]